MQELNPSKSAPREPYRGLCATCEHRTTCTYPHPKDRPVLFCEEFEGLCDNLIAAAGPISPLLRAAQTQTTGVRHEPRIEVRDKPSPYKGLCRTCENRETCTFPKPPDGVWHCEEFV